MVMSFEEFCEGIMVGQTSGAPSTQTPISRQKAKDREQKVAAGGTVGGRTVKKDADVRRIGGVTRTKRLTSNPKFSAKRSTLNKDKEIRTQLRANPTAPNMIKR